MKNRVYNFGAGPAALPESILREAQAECLNWHGLGLSVMEVGHRTDVFMALLREAEQDLRDLLSIPDHYHVLFLGGAARTQFATVPLNFIQAPQQGAYLVSGVWSYLALQEAQKLKQAYCLASSDVEQQFFSAPKANDWLLQPNTAYVYYTPNETVNGVRFPYVPKVNGKPLIADMTSCLLSEVIHVEDYGLIFAGSQKNIAPAGLTVVIVRDELLKQRSPSVIPTMFDYQTHVDHRSLYATPPVFNCYMAAKMFKWLKAQGGVGAMEKINRQKAQRLYQYIDDSAFYHCPIAIESRSNMNVCFSIRTSELEPLFLQQAEAQGLVALKGHRLVGGLRASLYNAMPMAGVEALLAFMQAFAKEHQG